MGHDTALLRVSHAGAEIVGAIGDDVSRRGGRSHAGHVVCHGGLCNGDGGAGENGADDTRHAILLDEAVVGVDGLGGVALGVVNDGLDLLAVDATVSVELLEVELRTVQAREAVGRVVAGVRAHDAHLDARRAVAALAAAVAAAAHEAEAHYRRRGAGHELAPGNVLEHVFLLPSLLT